MDAVAGTREQSPLAHVLRTGSLYSVYQPIVDLVTGDTVAYEALLRGPAGSALHLPGAIFAAAVSEGLVDAVEWAGIKSATEGALAAGMDPSISLLINVEGASAGRSRTPEQQAVLSHAMARLALVFEVTEGDLLANPGKLLLSVDRMKGRTYGLAIDDVGLNHPEGVAALEMVRPDVVKLDSDLVRGRSTPAQAAVGLAVQAFVEEHGGAVVAEGIETDEHLERALVLGATFGQGYLFGRPGPLPDPLPRPRVTIPLATRPLHILADTPHQIAEDHLRFRIASKRVLLPLSKQLEQRAIEAGPAVFLFSSFQKAHHFTKGTAARYAQLAANSALVAAFGAELDAEPAPGVRGITVSADDPLAEEWVVVVVAPHYAAALVARDIGDRPAEEMDRRFEFAMTHDRQLVSSLGRSLMSRIADREEPEPQTDRTVHARHSQPAAGEL